MRQSGILMPITCLPSQYGIGCFDKAAYEFADFLKESGQSYWQILPLGHTGYGDSPYQCFSAFAGNPYMIDLNELIAGSLLKKNECDDADFGKNPRKINYRKQYKARFPLLKKAYERSSLSYDKKYKEFLCDNEYWLNNYSLFMALKEHFGNKAWQKWNKTIKYGQEKDKYIELLNDKIDFWNFVQFIFACQWQSLKEYANKKGIQIIGDIPIYVSSDSCETWANPELFVLDDNLVPSFVAGCPPDGFSKKGQLWGNPVYRWEEHKKTNFVWWGKRLEYSFKMYDILRIDHFRGFDKFYTIPYGSKDATKGKWEEGPGYELFEKTKPAIADHPIIAEDLGFITPSVKKLLAKTGFAGIKILSFAFDKRNDGIASDHMPHNYPKNCVAYTGTHDNEPISSWFTELNSNAKSKVRKYLCDMYTPDDQMYKALICELMKSNADTVIIPIWDALGLGESARLNVPGTFGGNWEWRVSKKMLSKRLSTFLGELTRIYERN